MGITICPHVDIVGSGRHVFAWAVQYRYASALTKSRDILA